MSSVEVIPAADLTGVIQLAKQRMIQLLDEVTTTGGLHGDGIARVVLTGGGAGIGLLQALRDYQGDWSKVYVFFGDERNVPITHPDSNEGQAREALLDHIALPEDHIFGYGLGTKDLAQAAVDYEAILNEYAPQGFDLHLLGMGGEGHINSLFPDTDAVREDVALVVAVYDSPKPPPERVSLSLPAIARAERVWLLVAGEEKIAAAEAVQAGAPPLEYPAAGAKGKRETLLFWTR